MTSGQACLMCGDPAPEPLTGTRRYCSVVCRRNRENAVRRLVRRLAEVESDRESIDQQHAWAVSGRYPHLSPDPARHALKVAAITRAHAVIGDRLRALGAQTTYAPAYSSRRIGHGAPGGPSRVAVRAARVAG